MSDGQVFARLRQEITKTIELLKENHEGANPDDTKRLLNESKLAIGKDDYQSALAILEQAQLAARPTTEYLLSNAKASKKTVTSLIRIGPLLVP